MTEISQIRLDSHQDTQIRKIVDELIESELASIISTLGPTEENLVAILEAVEGQYSRGNFDLGEALRTSLDVYVGCMISELNADSSAPPLGVNELIRAFKFAAAYYELRDLIYLSFNDASSVSWSQDGSSIQVDLRNNDFDEQLVLEHNMFKLRSRAMGASSRISNEEMMDLMRSVERWDQTDPRFATLIEHIELETAHKLTVFFSYVPRDSEASMGGYTFRQFYAVYESMLLYSLYERKYAAARGLGCVITLMEDEAVPEFSNLAGVPRAVCNSVLRDIAASSRGTFNYIDHARKYLLLPFSFSLKDGVAAALKSYAARDSDGFSAGFARDMGDALVTEVAQMFTRYCNFTVETDLLLQQFDSSLPDIDVFAVSYEPSLGFHVFACEVKNILPATWAKEYLRATGKSGAVTKALKQVDKLKAFLASEQGRDLLVRKIEAGFPTLPFDEIFPTGYCITADFLVVTSQNTGLFFPERSTAIVSVASLNQIVERCDGDVNFILAHLWGMRRLIASSYSKSWDSIEVGGTTIRYSARRFESTFQIDEHAYLTNGDFERRESEALEAGYRFIDTLGIDRLEGHQNFLLTIR